MGWDSSNHHGRQKAGNGRDKGELVNLDSRGGDSPALAHAPCHRGDSLPNVSGSRGAGLNVPPTTAQPWPCSSARGFFQPHLMPQWVGFAIPSPQTGCVAGARATGMSMATPLLRAEWAKSVLPASVVRRTLTALLALQARQLWKDQVLIWKDGG